MKIIVRKTAIDIRALAIVLALALFAAGGVCRAEAPLLSSKPERIILNLTETSATSMAVTWRTEAQTAKPQAQIAVATGSVNVNAGAVTLDAVTEPYRIGYTTTVYAYSVVFKDLKPETLYAYRVGSDGAWSEWNQFRTAAAGPAPFKFVFFGDPQTDIESMCSRVFRMAFKKASDASFWLFTGDIVNEGERDNLWGELYNAFGWIPRTTPMILVPGNHEYKRTLDPPVAKANQPVVTETKGLSRLWRPQFTFPQNGVEGLEESSYYLDYQGVRFVMLNGTEKLEEQSKWLRKVLDKNPQRWTIVCIHQPFYSTGEDRDNPYNRMLFTKIFDKYKVDLLLQGHDHTYGRTYKLRNNARVGDGEQGTVYVVSVSGPKQYDPNSRFADLMPKMGTRTMLYQVISVDGDRLKYEAFAANGELFDSFELKK